MPTSHRNGHQTVGIWPRKNERKVFESVPFNILERRYITPKKSEFTAYVLDVPDWVNIIGVNQSGEILLIRQFRFGTEKVELEIPGGCIEKEETPEEAAIRELKEETGFSVRNIVYLGVVDANPAIMNNRCYTFYAELGDRGEPHFDPDEMIEIEFAPLNRVMRYLAEGKISNAYIVAAFFWLITYPNKELLPGLKWQ